MDTDAAAHFVSLLEQRGLRVRQTGTDRWQAQCPAHEDRNPSLSISIGERQPLVLHCHAGCDVDGPNGILASVGTTWRELGPTQPTDAPNTIVATYDYHDEDGRLAYQVVRLSPKGFRQRRPDGTGGWHWSVKGQRPLVYRLPEVRRAIADGQTIYIAEGEKDCDALVALGNVATCNAGGASKFTLDHASQLQGAQHVIVIADADEPGHKHARQVADHLAVYHVETTLVQAPTAKDVSEHLAAGHTLADLVPLPDAPPASPHPLASSLIDWDTFWQSDPSATQWLIEPIIAHGRAHAMYAGAKTGKSYVMLAIVAAAASGQPILDHPGGPPVDVLYLDFEMTEADLQERLVDFGYGPDSNLEHLHYALLPSLPPLDTAEGGQALIEAAEAVGAQLVVIDTTSRAIQGDENEADTLRAFYSHTGLRLKQSGIGWIRLDHAGKDKAKGQRGTSAKNDDVDIVVRLEKTEGGVRLDATHRRIGWYPESTDITIDDNIWPVRIALTQASYPEGTLEAAANLERLGVPMTASQREASRLYRAAGYVGRNAVILAAQRYRRAEAERQAAAETARALAETPTTNTTGSTAGSSGEHGEHTGSTTGSTQTTPTGSTTGSTQPSSPLTCGEQHGEQRGARSAVDGEHPAPLRGAQELPHPGPPTTTTDDFDI